ncbi:thiol reductant ABC exporter subunit CydC [Halalkalibacillus halophilus]|uniref:thiol reductant ABC exporter subunit CydC n=1 Tax=Halalkalibacillus halophilus TaxID=392827 RepID=UPI00040FDDF8|nr:thiol reductant ABC exporter subunit CydC [Halalkalibacillus halophilus]
MNELRQVTALLLKDRRDVLLSILFGFIAGIAAVGLFAASGYLISQAALSVPIYTLTIVIALVKLLGFTRAFSRYGERYFSHRATFNMLSRIRINYFKKLQQKSPSEINHLRTGDVMSRMVNDVESLQTYFLRVFYPPIVLVLIFLSTILFTSYFSIYIALVLVSGLLVTSLLLPLSLYIFRKKNNSSSQRKRSDLNAQVGEVLFGLRDLQIHQQLNDRKEKIKHIRKDYHALQEKEQLSKLAHNSMHGFFSLFTAWTVLLVGGALVSMDQLNPVFLAMFMLITLTVFENTTAMTDFSDHLKENKESANRIFDEQTNYMPQSKVKLDHPIQTIRFEQVNFTYSNEDRAVLEDISFEINPGTKTAIVGASGSGKSTILQLLLQLEHPDKGAIYINNFNAKDIAEESIWNNTNVLLQDQYFQTGTIKDNLRLGDMEQDNEMQEVLNKVGLEYLTLNDELEERAMNLSGGERQRLAIARILPKKASLWLLDEPTVSLDAENANNIMKLFKKRAENASMIIISHQLTGLESMDQILVMEDGKLIEVGDYQTLMQNRGLFYEMKQVESNLI